jgi:hypothetical protein
MCTDRVVADIENYDGSSARTFLYRICNNHVDVMKDFCGSAFGQGPFLFTYAHPASTLNQIPPPFIFVDLSSVDQGAFAEYIEAYKEQVKSADVTDGSKINTIRLKVLSLIMSATGILNPIEKSVAGILHVPYVSDDK